jgi:hypothetical protein
MKIAALLLVASLTGPISAHAATPAQCTRAWDERNAAHVRTADSYKTFMTACLRNQVSPNVPTIDRPDNAPGPATARCRDGLYSYSANPATACAQHRGVEAWLR